MTRKAVIAAISLVALAGCARLQFYKTEDLRGNETGIKFYTLKPYLLVARTGNKEKPVEVSVIFLPDLKNPLYASPRSGFGSSNLTLSLANGVITAMGQQTDTKVPELLSSFGGLAESLAAAKKTRREADLLQQAGLEFDTVVAELRRIVTGLEEQIKSAKAGGLLTPNEMQALQTVLATLRRSAQALSTATAEEASPDVIEELKQALELWQTQIMGPGAATTGPAPILHRN